MDNAWKDKLRERFSDYSVPEPEGLWEGIEQGMAGKRRRTVAPVWWLSGGLAAAAAIALVVLLPGPGSGPQATMPERMDDIAYVEPQEETPVLPESTSATPFEVVSRQTLLAEASVVKESDPVMEETDNEVVPQNVIPFEEIVAPEVPEEKTVPEVTVPEPVEKPVESFEISNDEKMALRKRYFIGVYREGAQLDASEQSHGFGMTQTGGFMTRATGSGGETKDVVRMLSANRASTFNARHDAPFRVGLKAALPLTGHLSLVSGVNWTALGSEFEESTVSTRTLVKQDLGYIGVPLHLETSYNPWKKLWVSASVGGMVEKGLMSKALTYSYIEDHLENKNTSHPDTGGLLWSLGASAGAEYRIGRTLGVYFAPGVEYHFDNGSDIRSAYTEKPLNWSLSVGLRFNIEK